MTDKNRYRNLCETDKTIPIFSRSWWLDAVCGENNWDVAIVERGGDIIGSMPYYKKVLWRYAILTQPPLTQTLGPWIRHSNAKYSKILGYQKDVMDGLIKQLPHFDYFFQNWHYSNLNWLPFYWHGFQQTTNYTYVLSNLADESKLWSDFQENIRTDIRKASKRFGLQIKDDLEVSEFLHLNRLTFSRQRKKMPYSESLVTQIDSACVSNCCRKIFIAEDSEGKRHAGVYIIWDENSAYYLLGGSDPLLRNSGAMSLCLWEAIRFAATVTMRFDFEGSMIEPVERFCRAFGAKQTPYFNITKTPSRILRLRQFLVS